MAEEANFDEAVTAEAKASNDMEIDLKEERKTQAYQEKMNIDIEKLSHMKRETNYIQLNGGKYTKLQNQSFFKKSDTFPDYFIKRCKYNANEDINIPLEVKNYIKQIATEQGLYAQVVKLRQKDLKFIAENKNKIEAKFKFQGQSARSQRWFDLEFDWIDVDFRTHEPDFYKKKFQSHDNTQDNNITELT